MDNTYLTKFNGEIDISAAVDKMALKIIIAKFIDRFFGESASLDEESDMFYLSGEIDDSNEVVEKLIIAMYDSLVITDDIVISAQGEDPKDRWDIVIKPDGVYIQQYEQIKGSLIKYK
jgi:hypothetical protein